MTLTCKNCQFPLTDPLWKDQGEYYIPCFHCGADNLVIPALALVIGYRFQLEKPLHYKRIESKSPELI